MTIDLKRHFKNIDELLKNYRLYAAYCANAVDAMDWYVDGAVYSSEVRAIRDSRFESLLIKAHIDTMLKVYKTQCRHEKQERRYNIINRKYLEPYHEGGRLYTNEQLADLFDCDVSTVVREIRRAKQALKVLMFGV